MKITSAEHAYRARLSIEHATRALVSAINRNGMWEAFQLRPGGSQSWTTAVVLHALGTSFRACPTLSSVPLIQRCWKRAWQNLYRLRAGDGSIGFNTTTPSDADSTIWLRRAMEQRRLLVGLDDLVDSRWLEQVDKFIEAHKQPDGVHTYIVEDGILRYVGLDGTTQSGWLGPHSCVSINYIALKSELGSALNPCNLSFALTDPFWWAESDIVWWLAYSAFGLPPYDQETCRYLSRFLPDRAISCRGIDRLQHIMLNHASSCLWQPCFTLRVPDHSDLTGQNTQYSVYSDVEAALCRDNGIFTTALCVSSLASTLLRKASSLC